MKIVNLIVLGLLILICVLGTFYKHISFGLGLGDILGYFFLYIGTITHFILTIVSRKKGLTRHTFLTSIFLIFTIFIALKATIWRGREYAWNGSIFYLPCPTKVIVENQGKTTEKLIQMCTMEYESEFSGIWDGQKILLKKGQLLIPEDLEKFVKKPIISVEIEPEVGKKTGNVSFDKSALIVNEMYSFQGTIVAVKDNKAIMKVLIK